MSKKIEFDFDELSEFISDVEDENVGRCGDIYYTKYKLTKEGKIQYRYTTKWTRDFLTEDQKKWKNTDYKGVIKNE